MKINARHRRLLLGQGQSSMEFTVVCVALALALGLGMSGEQSVLYQLLGAFKSAYQNFSYAISLPG